MQTHGRWPRQPRGWQETMTKRVRTLVFVAAFLLADALICWVVVARPF